MSLFTLENLEFARRDLDIIKGVSMNIEKGTSVLVGKAGSGKSTLLKLMAGILIPTSGKVSFEGQNISTMTKAQNLEFRRRCAFVFQDSALWENQTIEQNLTLPLKIHYPNMSKMEIDFSIQGICAMVNFDKPLSLRPAALSMGERKKVAFARAMICGPEVLFLDECTESLDNRGVELISNLLHNFLEQGNSIIYISHNSGFIQDFPGKTYHISEGKLSDEI